MALSYARAGFFPSTHNRRFFLGFVPVFRFFFLEVFERGPSYLKVAFMGKAKWPFLIFRRFLG